MIALCWVGNAVGIATLGYFTLVMWPQCRAWRRQDVEGGEVGFRQKALLPPPSATPDHGRYPW